MSNDFLIKDARELLAIAEKNPQVQDYYRRLPLGQIWASGARSGRHQILHEEQSSHDAITRLQEILFVHSPSAKEAELAVDWYQDTDMAWSVEASSIVPESSVVHRGNKRYWHDDFRHAGMYERIAGCDVNIRTVVELGAGCGGLARLITLHSSVVRYIVVDLPDTLAYSMMFLRANFPDVTWQWVEAGEAPKPDAQFVFVPVGFESCLHGQHFDAFINTASLGETRHETVRHWFDFVQERCRFDWIFSVNRFLNVVSPDEMAYRKEENGHAFCFDRRWEIVDWELSPRFLQCPWMNRHARQVLIFGKRVEQPIEYDYHLLLDANAGSWNHAKNDMTNFAPALNEDFTMTGVLFKLWEAHRLNPNDGTRAALKRYMAFLAGGATFEDEVYL